jgi:post-segregation antitoxin (ccd killing protein)
MNEVAKPSYIGKYLCESNRRKNVMVTVRRDLLQTAREIGINLSKLLENTLIQTLEAQTKPLSPNEKNTDTRSVSHREDWWAGRDLNLRPQPRKGCVLTMLDDRPIVQNYGVKCFIKNTCAG